MSNNELFSSLKVVADRFISMLHDLYGLYHDATSGFSLYLKDLQLKSWKDGQSLIVSNSDPTDKKALILHEALISDIISRNSKDGENYNKIRRFIIVMISEHWEHDIREKIADVFGLKDKDEVKSNIMAEINKIRQDVLHNRGKVSNCAANKMLKFCEGEELKISEADFFKIFEEIFKYINDLFSTYTGQTAYPDNSLHQEAKRKHLSMEHTILR